MPSPPILMRLFLFSIAAARIAAPSILLPRTFLALLCASSLVSRELSAHPRSGKAKYPKTSQNIPEYGILPLILLFSFLKTQTYPYIFLSTFRSGRFCLASRDPQTWGSIFFHITAANSHAVTLRHIRAREFFNMPSA